MLIACINRREAPDIAEPCITKRFGRRSKAIGAGIEIDDEGGCTQDFQELIRNRQRESSPKIDRENESRAIAGTVPLTTPGTLRDSALQLTALPLRKLWVTSQQGEHPRMAQNKSELQSRQSAAVRICCSRIQSRVLRL